MQAALKTDCTKYFEYLFIYVVDIHVVSHRASAIMENHFAIYCFKENPSNSKMYGTPNGYLGATLVFTHHLVISVANKKVYEFR